MIRILLVVALVACGSKPPPAPVKPPPPVEPPHPPPAPVNVDLDSKDVLSRADEAPEAYVRHVLFGWKDLAENYGGGMDDRAKDRSQEEAAKLATKVAGEVRADPSKVEALVEQYSEDPGGREPYHVTPAEPFVAEFKSLALRLKIGEVGIVKTKFGYHVILRVPTPAPDPLESADILARPPEAGPITVQIVLIGWKGKTATGATRTKPEADQLAKDVLAKAGTGDMAALMKQYSEDPGSKDNAHTYELKSDTDIIEPFKKLGLRLHVNEAGMVATPFGWIVMKRVPPPPPDSLESTAIMKRAQVTDHAKVKHILLGWTDVNAGDDRAKKRDRKALEKLVKATVQKLQKGAKIEPLMKELSEDPGSAESGESYDVTPEAGLVPPFLQLSLRLKVKEIGVVKTDFGIHIIQRIE